MTSNNYRALQNTSMDGEKSHWRFGSLSLPSNFSDCPPNSSQWIWNVFSECANEGRDVASVVLGLVSILCFVASSFPQYYRSCKTGNMDKALSIWFLMGWLGGDSCNFVGAFLSHQLPLQTYTAVYYVLADLLMLFLYVYYKFRNQGPNLSTPINAVCGFVVFGSVAVISSLQKPEHDLSYSAVGRRHLLAVNESGEEPFTTQDIIGFVIGSISSVMYLCSRIPQIITNFKRRSTEGLALSLFCLVILGNLMYGLSILLKAPDNGQSESNYLLHHLPWLVGSLGVMSLDVIIIFQFILYHKKSSSSLDETTPILGQQRSPIYT
ncbi:lysosomal amino acid transporter 1 homolog [Bombina bombina]|uniref:lysosomal amino acid transporter 1 homolog n=1 Tax=Bombina bombina TaxID=8345 RepID=UPI00235A7962|nr:lysosomal amino acid transporter 1 homolog [Bombina bombina]